MQNYEKPIVLFNEDVAEGIYAASGAPDIPEAGVSGGSATVSKIELTSPGNEYYKVNTYTVTIRNGGSEGLPEWSANVPVTSGTVSDATIYNTWVASAAYSNNTITIKSGNGGGIGAGQEIQVELVVSYSSEAVTLG